jgi:hypothetical protein
MRRTSVVLTAVMVVVIAASTRVLTHDIPRSVTVNMFVHAEKDRLDVLIRVPLAAMRDIDFPQRDGFLDIPKSEPLLLDAVAQWILPDLKLLEGGRILSAPTVADVRISLPSDRSFTSLDEARAHLDAASLPDTVRLPREQALVDVWLAYPIESDAARFSIEPEFQRLGIDVLTVVRFVKDGSTRAFEFSGDPGVVRLDPRWHQAAAQFVSLGFLHILDGADHLLFLACLVIPLRRLRSLVVVVSTFTLAHSITLIGSAMGLAPGGLWFPPAIELLIAASIVFMAIENIVAMPSLSRRCVMAFGFGLVHGFGFSFALRQTLQFAGAHLLASLVSFNVGVELGQLLVLIGLVPVLQLLFRFVVTERLGTIVLSVLVGHTAWHWMTERWTTLRAYEGAPIDSISLVVVVRMALLTVVTIGLIWLRQWSRARRRAAEAALDESSDARPA